jgi:hypothetical protein
MTIGIGVLATGSEVKPDTIILVSDTMGSVGDDHSTDKLYKQFSCPDEHLYVVAADQIDKAAELVPIMQRNLGQLAKRSHGTIQEALFRAVFTYHCERSGFEILPKYRLAREDWAKPMDSELRQRVTADLIRFYLGCQLVIGTFDDSGRALLYRVHGVPLKQHEDGSETVEYLSLCNFPGYSVIGSGTQNADFWLAFRGHTLSCSPQRAAYHAFEAKLMAETSAHVNTKTHLLVATKDEHFQLTEQHPEQGDWSLTEFSELYKTLGPQSTEMLGISKQSD